MALTCPQTGSTRTPRSMCPSFSRVLEANNKLYSYWTNEFAMFYNPDTGLNIDGAWIDMNEPSSVCIFDLTLGFYDSTYYDSSVITLAQIHLSRQGNKISPRHAIRCLQIPPPQSSGNPPLRSAVCACVRESIIAERTYKILRIISRTTPALEPCLTAPPTYVPPGVFRSHLDDRRPAGRR